MPIESQLPTPLNAPAARTVQATSSAATLAAVRQAGQAAASSAASIDYDTFLKLLVAEMKNQDPTSPADPTKYVAQLATFSSVEQAIATNNKLDELLLSNSLAQADGVLGRTVTSRDGSLSGEVTGIRIDTGGAVAVLADGREIPLAAGVTIS